MLGVPGNMMNVAELGDVEPRRMPFHATAQAKLYQLKQDPIVAWYLEQCPLDWLRSEALGVMHQIGKGKIDTKAPQGGAMDAQHAIVLRSGWDKEDVAVASSCCSSRMPHMHNDNGTILIGTFGSWMLTDPGYQQYANTSEREFTLGIKAHNTPVINGKAPIAKIDRKFKTHSEKDLYSVEHEIAQNYPTDLKLKSVTRNIWLKGRELVVVADRIMGEQIESIHYYWHGNPDGAWWVQDQWARIYLNGKTLWFTSPQTNVIETNLQRLRGSRGHLTLEGSADSKASVIWWIFCLGEKQPKFTLESPHQLRIGREVFEKKL